MRDEEIRAKQLEAATRVANAVAAFAEEHPAASAFQVAIVAQTVASSYRTPTVEEVALGVLIEEAIRLDNEEDQP